MEIEIQSSDYGADEICVGAEAVGGGWREMLRVIGVLLVDERCLREMHRVRCVEWDV